MLPYVCVCVRTRAHKWTPLFRSHVDGHAAFDIYFNAEDIVIVRMDLISLHHFHFMRPLKCEKCAVNQYLAHVPNIKTS